MKKFLKELENYVNRNVYNKKHLEEQIENFFIQFINYVNEQYDKDTLIVSPYWVSIEIPVDTYIKEKQKINQDLKEILDEYKKFIILNEEGGHFSGNSYIFDFYLNGFHKNYKENLTTIIEKKLIEENLKNENINQNKTDIFKI